MLSLQAIVEKNRSEIRQLAERLQAILTEIKPSKKRIPPGYRKKSAADADGINCDEVYSNIFLGDGLTAKKKKYLKRIGVTHVLNAAMGSCPTFVNTTSDFYGEEFKYHGVCLEDVPITRIHIFFDNVAEFIDDALQSGGKAYVHCVRGVSRSATCVIAFLMLKKSLSAETALTMVRKRRHVAPNSGFLFQLAALEFQLREERADYPANGTDVIGKKRKCDIL